jgi:hypothetical protein
MVLKEVKLLWLNSEGTGSLILLSFLSLCCERDISIWNVSSICESLQYMVVSMKKILYLTLWVSNVAILRHSMNSYNITRRIHKISSVCRYCRCNAAVTIVRMRAEDMGSRVHGTHRSYHVIFKAATIFCVTLTTEVNWWDVFQHLFLCMLEGTVFLLWVAGYLVPTS